MTSQNAAINMIKQQLRTNEVHNEIILSLFDSVPRQKFVPAAFHDFAYSDMRIPLAHGQQMMTPEEEARLLQGLNLRGNETVLEIGTGSGYLTALLSRLVKKVISVDYFNDFITAAKQKTTELGYDNIEYITGDGSHGWLDRAPFDVIVMTGAIPALTKSLKLQVISGGKIFAIVGKEPIMFSNLLTLDHLDQWHEALLFETCTPQLIDKLKSKHFCF